MKKRRFKLSTLYLVLLLAIMYIPIIMVVIYSFNDSKTDAVWGGFTLGWYGKMSANTGLMDTLKNSLILALCACAVSAVIGTLGAVGLARANFRTKGLLESVSLLPIMIPEIILGMAFLSFFSFLKLPAGMFTLVIAHSSFCIPYVLLNVKSRLVGIDKSIGEAARDLGASQMRMFFDITLPLIAPAVLSGMLLSFAMSMDDVVISFFVTGPETNTLPIKIFSQIKVGVTPEINALCTVMLLVTFCIVAISSSIGRVTNSKNNSKGDLN